MKKDQIIDKALSAFAERVKPPEADILHDALLAVRQGRVLGRGDRVPARRHKALFVGLAVAASVAVAGFSLVMLGQLISGGAKNSPTVNDANEAPGVAELPPGYTLSSLTMQHTTASQIEILVAREMLTLPVAAADTAYTLYFDGEDPVVIALNYRRTSDHGTERIRLLIDLGQRLADYESYWAGTPVGTTGAHVRERYEGGEYRTDMCVRRDGIDYYVELQSPENGRGELYILALIEGGSLQ
ncbi:MAG: hypothetical protein LBM78_02665 [Clostridiales bacterium]|jgi:hypothetical protein|nr:hypothetical protein [Clostridiales bacterium]